MVTAEFVPKKSVIIADFELNKDIVYRLLWSFHFKSHFLCFSSSSCKWFITWTHLAFINCFEIYFSADHFYVVCITDGTTLECRADLQSRLLNIRNSFSYFSCSRTYIKLGYVCWSFLMSEIFLYNSCISVFCFFLVRKIYLIFLCLLILYWQNYPCFIEKNLRMN